MLLLFLKLSEKSIDDFVLRRLFLIFVLNINEKKINKNNNNKCMREKPKKKRLENNI